MTLFDESKSGNPEPTRIIVGLDFGTTHTGLAYADTDSIPRQSVQERAHSIKVIRQFPNHGREVCKVPSRIAYRSENLDAPRLPNNDQEIFTGFEVRPGWEQYTWFKLRLDQDARVTAFDDPSLAGLSSSNEGIMQLPSDKGPITVCEEFLEPMYKILMEKLRGEYGTVLDETPIDVFVTVPAIWGDPAKRYTKMSAKRAGFGGRQNIDTMVVISEPEAAATLALTAYSGCGIRNQVEAGDGMMVVDLGGGTADTTTYLITQSDPEIRFRELIVGEGGKVGSTAVNRSFDRFCKDKFGQAYESLPVQKKGPGSAFMNAFEELKHAFEGQNGLEDHYEVPLNIPDQNDCENFDADDRNVLFTSADMEEFFKPSVTKVLKIVKSQLNRAKAVMPNDGKINLCVFVGGYSASRYLQGVLRRECETLGLNARFPHEPQSAIVKGAVLRGLGGVRPDTRCCRRHYGFAIAKPFREDIDPEYLGFVHTYYQKKYCRGRMSWVIEKGDTVDQFTTIEKDIEWLYQEKTGQLQPTYKLYGCSEDVARKYITHNGVEQVGEILVDFAGVDLRPFSWKQIDGQRVCKIKFNLEVSLGHEDGLLQVRALIRGREIARARFNFNDLEASQTDTTPSLTAPGAPARRTPTASNPRPTTTRRAAPRSVVRPKSTIAHKRSATLVVSKGQGTILTAHRSSPSKRRKLLHMDVNELSKTEDSE